MLLRRLGQREKPGYQDSITRLNRCSGSAGVRCGAQSGQMENSSLRYNIKYVSKPFGFFGGVFFLLDRHTTFWMYQTIKNFFADPNRATLPR